MKLLTAFSVFLGVILAPTQAFSVTLPYTFSSGTSIQASQVNANDQALRDGINNHIAQPNGHNTTLSSILAVDNSCGTHSINFNGHQAENLLVQNVSADPSCAGASAGKLIFNTTSGSLKVCDGSSFAAVGSGGGVGSSVASVNGATGVVVLDSDDIAQGSTNAYYQSTVAKSDLIAQTVTPADIAHAPSGSVLYTSLLGKQDSLPSPSGQNGKVLTVSANAYALATPSSGYSSAVAASDLINQIITPSDIAHAPSGDAVFTAISSVNTALSSKISGPLSGDVITSGSVATIQPLAVSNSKIANATIDLTSKVTGTLPVGNGGTGIPSFTTGDILYATGATTLAKLGIGSTGQVVTVVGGVPSWQTPSSGSSSTVSVYGAIVGSTAQVLAGQATHDTIAAAVSATSSGASIKVLPGTYTAAVSLASKRNIECSGNGSNIDGTFTFAVGSNYSSMSLCRVNGNITISSNGVSVQHSWISSSSTVSDNGTGNYVEVIKE